MSPILSSCLFSLNLNQQLICRRRRRRSINYHNSDVVVMMMLLRRSVSYFFSPSLPRLLIHPIRFSPPRRLPHMFSLLSPYPNSSTTCHLGGSDIQAPPLVPSTMQQQHLQLNNNNNNRDDAAIMSIFEEWMVINEKTYDSLAEKQYRFKIFKEFLEPHMGPNDLSNFADLNHNELLKTVGCTYGHHPCTGLHLDFIDGKWVVAEGEEAFFKQFGEDVRAEYPEYYTDSVVKEEQGD